MKIIGHRTGLVFPNDVRTLDELCLREREAAAVPLPSGNPDTSVEQWIRDKSKAWGVTREVAIEMRKSLREITLGVTPCY